MLHEHLIEDAAALSTAPQREAMAEAFTIATRYELLFWDTALNTAPWPLAEVPRLFWL